MHLKRIPFARRSGNYEPRSDIAMARNDGPRPCLWERVRVALDRALPLAGSGKCDPARIGVNGYFFLAGPFRVCGGENLGTLILALVFTRDVFRQDEALFIRPLLWMRCRIAAGIPSKTGARNWFL